MMPIPDMTSVIGDITQTLDPAVITADANGAGMDKQGFGSTLHLANVGESADTLSGSVYIDIIIQDSADNTTFAAVTDATKLRGTMTTLASGIVAVIDAAADDDVVVSIEYIGDKRYSRLVWDVTGTHTSGTPGGMTGINFNPKFGGSLSHHPSF